ncbi:MAG: peptide chain release factor N(5)-glutamine methyltransferase [Puniceicoccales bacterium]|jgi:release factor glutamine methyltransferase|nr:peptide chain release factor N(5)-glutamine methyltransferase [Puniceicoccales bacterium]
MELVRSAEEFLGSKGVTTARLDAEWLLSHALGKNRMELRLGRGIDISQLALLNFWKAVKRRGNREPLQHIIGEVEFHGLVLTVNKNVLIPRHETEELVEKIIARIKNKAIGSILDLGTGSGAIGLALAKNFPHARVLAVDISEIALGVASGNAVENKISNIAFLQSNWFEKIHGQFDLIVSNPPYLSSEELQMTDNEVKGFEPELALIAGDGGLASIFTIIESAGDFLRKDGLLAMETGYSQHERIASFAKKYFQNLETARDLFGRDRFVFLRESPGQNFQ